MRSGLKRKLPPALADLHPHWTVLVGLTVVIAAAYFFAARLSLALISKPDGVAVFWPAAGVSAGVLIALGPLARVPVIVGTIGATVAANLLGDRNIWSALTFALCNTIEPAIVAVLVERFFGSPFRLDSLSRVFGLFAAAVIATALSGVIATIGYLLFHPSSASAFTIWSHWFTSDTIGVVTVAPLLIGCFALARDRPLADDVIEGVVALLLLAGLAGLVFHLPSQAWAVEITVALFFPLSLWIAARCHPVFAAAAAFVFALAVVWTTTFGIGVFANPELAMDERVLSAQASILATSLGALVLAALFSERRRHETIVTDSEARLQGALEVGGVMAFDWTRSARQTRRSENAPQILGHHPEESFGVGAFLARIHPDDRERFKACIRDTTPQRPSYLTSFRYLRPDGQQVWLEEAGQGEFDAAGRLVQVRGLTRDVTERKSAEAELAASRKVAELADRAKSGFLAAASHDLRQPLQTLTLLGEALKPHVRGGDGTTLITRIERSLDVMKDVLDSLLDINRLETGALRPVKTDIRLDELLDAIEGEFLQAVRERGLEWRLVKCKAAVHSDRRMLELMLRNLLSNAMRYTERGTILVGCRRAGDNIRLEVWDSGIGISEEHIARIFDEYYQVDAHAHQGSFGLGLAIVQRLGNLLGHPIRVRSAPGRGSRFSIEIPLAQSRPERAGPVDVREGGRDLHGEILVIEDDSFVRSGLEVLLGSYGLTVVCAANGDMALDLITKEGVHPDLVLSDFNLPGSMNGIQSIEAARSAMGWKVPAIVLTGDIRTEVLEAIAKHDVLIATKPIKVEHLLQLITDPHVHAKAG